MVHLVHILSYTPRSANPGALQFQLDGRVLHARCDADPVHARDVFAPGATYPVSLTVATEGKAEYADPGQAALKVIAASDSGDRVSVLGRTWDSIDHQTIKLDASPTVSLRLNLPQLATDFRGGSWLSATGLLCADLPADDH